MKKLIVFDLDGTLAESKSALDGEMAGLLVRLMDVFAVAIISGGAWPQFQKQLLAHLPKDQRLKRLSILPTCGTKFYQFDGDWRVLYSEDIASADKVRIMDAMDKAFDEAGYRVDTVWGERVEDRGSQITLSALGQDAPLGAKAAWDPDFTKRQAIKAILTPMIPGFSVNLGGATSIDVTRPGIDKAYGIHKLRDILGFAIDEMVFIGDAIFPGGNDYPAKQAGVDSIQVRDSQETKRVIETLLICAESGVERRKTLS